jgi:outer membrane protein assembly factor BamB
MSHSSIMPMTLNGKKMYVYAAIGGVVGISAEGNNIGKILWETNEFKPSVVAPSPVILDNGKIFLTAGYGAGSILFRVQENNHQYKVEVLQKIKPQEGLASEQQTPIFYKGYLFGILPKDAGTDRNEFVCYNPDDCTQMVWSSGKTNRFGLGPYLVADDKIFILDDDGTLSLIKASTKEYVPLAKKKIMDGTDAWGPLALADRKLLLRDSKRMICLDLSMY